MNSRTSRPRSPTRAITETCGVGAAGDHRQQAWTCRRRSRRRCRRAGRGRRHERVERADAERRPGGRSAAALSGVRGGVLHRDQRQAAQRAGRRRSGGRGRPARGRAARAPTGTRSGPPVARDPGADPEAVRRAERQADGAGGGAGDHLGGHRSPVAVDLDHVADRHVDPAHQQVQATQLGEPAGPARARGVAHAVHQGVVTRPRRSGITRSSAQHLAHPGERRRPGRRRPSRPRSRRPRRRGRPGRRHQGDRPVREQDGVERGPGPRGAAGPTSGASTGTPASARRTASPAGSSETRELATEHRLGDLQGERRAPGRRAPRRRPRVVSSARRAARRARRRRSRCAAPRSAPARAAARPRASTTRRCGLRGAAALGPAGREALRAGGLAAALGAARQRGLGDRVAEHAGAAEPGPGAGAGRGTAPPTAAHGDGPRARRPQPTYSSSLPSRSTISPASSSGG